MYAGPGKTKNNIYFELFVFAVMCGIPFVAHQTYWWCALCLYFLNCLNPANVWHEHTEQFARFERLRFNVIIIHPIMTLRFGMYTSFKRLRCRGNSLCVSDHFSYAASFASSCSSRVQLNCPGNVHLQLQHFNSFQNQRLPPTLPDPLDTTNTSS